MIALTLASLALLPPPPPENGVDDWVDAVEARIERLDEEGAPGVAVAIVVDGAPARTWTVGLADLESGAPIETSTRFYLASLAKPFTATCAVHAARSGAIDLDAPLDELFAELPDAANAATLRDCLHHRSGVPDIYEVAIGADLGRDAIASNAAALGVIAKLPASTYTRPGDTVYCNTGYVLLAEAVRRGTKKDLATYASEHLFEPLGMSHARFSTDHSTRPVCYRRSEDEWQQEEFATGLTGPGGLDASLDDLIAFDAALRSDDAGSPASFAAALPPADAPHHPVIGPYAAGWMMQRIGGRAAMRHFGGAAAHSADLLRFPELGLTVVVLSNREDVGAEDFSVELAKLVLGDRFEEPSAPEAVALEPAQRAAFRQFWREPTTRRPVVLLQRGNEFELVTLGDVRVRLVPVAADTLEAVGAQAPYTVVATDGHLVVRREGAEPERLEPVPFPPTERPEVAAHAGRWRCVGLDAVIELDVSRGGLAIVQHDAFMNLPPFHALGGGLFLCDAGAALQFENDDDGRPTAFWMDTNRARGLRFVRAE